MKSKNLLIALAILTTVCISPMALCQEGKKTVTIRVKNGKWGGTTSLGDKISFEVKDYKVVGLTFPIKHSCKEINVEGSNIKITMFPMPSKISRTTGAFRIPLNGPKLTESPETQLPLKRITMQGRIRADGTASGTLEFAGVCLIPAKIIWNATYKANETLD